MSPRHGAWLLAYVACAAATAAPPPATGGGTPPATTDHAPAAGHGDAHAAPAYLTCDTLTNSSDIFTTCAKQQCASANKNQADACLKIITPYPDFTACEAERCMCASGKDSWVCGHSECHTKCDTCACFETINPFTSRSCEADYRVCAARVIKAVLETDTYLWSKDCPIITNCVNNSINATDCRPSVRAAVPGASDACQDAVCSTAAEVQALLGGTAFMCPPEPGNCAHGHHADPPFNIIVLTGMMALGNLCRYYSSTFPLSKLPYTVQVFLLGAGWGALCEGMGGSLRKYGELGDIDPHLLFYIFLPILIFESAFATEFHVFKDVKWHCICLAGPGLIICTTLTAFSSQLIFTRYNWDLVTCLLFGCMLSATDPVAVVALLKELGAAPAISQLIEGESLLNDGTAIVFFNILRQAVVPGEITLTVPEILGELLKVAGGGVVLGAVIGVIVKTCIKKVFNDPEIEITMTLVAAYATFFIAEQYLLVSGVLGLVVLGMYLAYHSHVISPEVEHSLHHFWEIIVYMGNTMIFCIAGIVITEKAFAELEGFDLVYLLINYGLLNVFRGFALGVLLVPMNMVGTYQLDWRNGILCTWGGLRGAVGLALALIIAGDAEIACKDPKLGARFLFHVAGIVILTLCVNGVTTGWVVGKLGLDKIEVNRQRATTRMYNDLIKSIDDSMYEHGRNPVFRDANWTHVRKYVTNGITDPHEPRHKESGGLLEAGPIEVMEDACMHYYRVFKEAVEHEYEAGTMRPSSMRVLLALLANAEADFSTGGHRMISGDFLRGEFDTETFFGKCSGVQDRWTHAFDVGIGFLTTHGFVLAHIDGVCFSAQASNKVKDHCKKVRKETIHILEDYGEKRPEIASALKSRNAARDVLNKVRGYIAKHTHQGKISSNDSNVLKGMVEDNMKNLRNTPKTLGPENPEQLLIRVCPWYTVDDNARQMLHNIVSYQMKQEKENLIGKARDGAGLFVLLSGVVRVHIGNRAENFGPGYVGGVMSVLTGKLGKYTEVFAETDCSIAYFDIRPIRELCQRNQKFSAEVWDSCCQLVARKVLAISPLYKDWEHVKLKNFASKGKRHAVQPSEAYPTALPSDSICILISGEYKDVMQGRESGQGPCMVPPHLNAVFFSTDSVLFVIRNPLSPQEKALKNWSKIRNKIFTVRAIACLQGHEAGIRAVREVLEGRMTSMFANLKAGTPPQQPENGGMSGAGSQTVSPVASPSHAMPGLSSPTAQSAPQYHHPLRANSGDKYSSQSSFPPNSSFPTNGVSRTNRAPRQPTQRNSSRKAYDDVEMQELKQRLNQMEGGGPGSPITESTPWFSQSEAPTEVAPSVRSTHRPAQRGGQRAYEGGGDFNTPLLRASEAPRGFHHAGSQRAFSQDDMSHSSF